MLSRLIGKTARGWQSMPNWRTGKGASRAVSPAGGLGQGHPGDTSMRLILAQAYREANEDLMAIEQYEVLLKREPHNVQIFNNLAWIYHLQGDERSIRLADKAQRLSRDTGAVSDTLGWRLVGRGDLGRAVALLRLAATQSPEVPAIQHHLAVAVARSGDGRWARRMTGTEDIEPIDLDR
jgi:Flp pilus assembly protein TadD